MVLRFVLCLEAAEGLTGSDSGKFVHGSKSHPKAWDGWGDLTRDTLVFCWL